MKVANVICVYRIFISATVNCTFTAVEWYAIVLLDQLSRIPIRGIRGRKDYLVDGVRKGQGIVHTVQNRGLLIGKQLILNFMIINKQYLWHRILRNIAQYHDMEATETFGNRRVNF